MALGGGTFTSQNKVLPGAYINFISTKAANVTVSDRGIASMPIESDWGPAGEIFMVSNANFLKHSMEYFGYSYTDEKLKGLRDLFKYAQKVYFYRLNGSGDKASNTFATAKYPGVRGNDISVAVAASPDLEDAGFIVTTYITSEGVQLKLDEQTVKTAAELVDNDYVVFKKGAELTATAATPLTGGTNGAVTGASHQAYIDAAESVAFNTMGVITSDEATASLYVTNVIRMREQVGKKYQLVLFGAKAPDHEGVINICPENTVNDTGWAPGASVYWVTGVEAYTAINKSATNKKYDGEFDINTPDQEALENDIKSGYLTFHSDMDTTGTKNAYILEDIDSLTTLTEDKGAVFQDNQTIRICDNIAMDIASVFKYNYTGKMPNDAPGRASFKGVVMQNLTTLQTMRAIQNLTDDSVTVEQGDDKHAVVCDTDIEIVNFMTHLYMTVRVA